MLKITHEDSEHVNCTVSYLQCNKDYNRLKFYEYNNVFAFGILTIWWNYLDGLSADYSKYR